MNMVERVARAICRAQHAQWGYTAKELDKIEERYWPGWQNAANSAIEAIDNTGSNMAASGHATKRVSGNT